MLRASTPTATTALKPGVLDAALGYGFGLRSVPGLVTPFGQGGCEWRPRPTHPRGCAVWPDAGLDGRHSG